MATYLQSDGEGTGIDVWVVPGASRTRIVGPYGEALKVAVASPPEAGKANKALVRLFEKRLGCRVELVAGASDRRKKLRVSAPLDEVREKL